MKKTPITYDRFIFNTLREVSSIKTSELARRADLSPTTIHNIRIGPRHGGTRYPRFETLLKLLNACGKTFTVKHK